MNISFSASTSKELLFTKIREVLVGQEIGIAIEDTSRPWGGFFVLDEASLATFAGIYFPDLPASAITGYAKLSPKILVVAPTSRLSWQYHHRRAEVWQVAAGEIAVMTSPTDAEGETKTYLPSERIVLECGERHRLIGLDSWGIVAEIWQHTDPQHPSDEDDIVRVQDDFMRK